MFGLCDRCRELTHGDCGRHGPTIVAVPAGEWVSAPRPLQAQRCPVCLGGGSVPAGFYDDLPATGRERCHSCRGRGIVWGPEGG